MARITQVELNIGMNGHMYTEPEILEILKQENILSTGQIFYLKRRNLIIFKLLKMEVGILLILKRQKKFIININHTAIIENMSYLA